MYHRAHHVPEPRERLFCPSGYQQSKMREEHLVLFYAQENNAYSGTAACDGWQYFYGIRKEPELSIKLLSIEDGGSLSRNPFGIVVIDSSLTVMEHPLIC